MPARLKPEWLARLREIDPLADLRFNATVGRWEFLLVSADGVLRSQFFGRFYWVRADGQRVPIQPDPETGLHPFRDLDDAAIEEVCVNLEASFIGNRYDGVRSTRQEVLRRHRSNEAMRTKFYREAGELWADMYFDRLNRIKGNPQVPVLVDLTPRPNPKAQVLGPDGQPTKARAA